MVHDNSYTLHYCKEMAHKSIKRQGLLNVMNASHRLHSVSDVINFSHCKYIQIQKFASNLSFSSTLDPSPSVPMEHLA